MENKLITIMKTVLVFVGGEIVKQVTYKTKSIAIKEYKLFIKYGHLDYLTGNKIENATFELL